MANAGWEPVTGVKTGDADVLVARYGGRRDFYLVLYNTSGAEKHLRLGVDRSVVDWPASAKVEEISGSDFNPDRVKPLTETGRLTLASGEELVFHIGHF